MNLITFAHCISAFIPDASFAKAKKKHQKVWSAIIGRLTKLSVWYFFVDQESLIFFPYVNGAHREIRLNRFLCKWCLPGN